MRKLITLSILLLSIATLNARTVKLTVADYFDADIQKTPLSFSDEGFTITATKGTQSKPQYISVYEDFRVYAGGTITVEATNENMIQIDFILSSEGKQLFGAINPNTGTSHYANKKDSIAAWWTGNAQKVVFTLGAKADYGTGDNSKSQKFCFLAVRIITDGEGPDIDDTPDLTKHYPFTQGRATFYGTKYTANNNFTVELYSDGIELVYDSELQADVVEGTGTYAMFDLYTANAQTFTGTYTSAKGSAVGGLDCGDGTSSVWYACGRSNCLDPQLLNGSITITCGTSGLYYIDFDVKDTEGNVHKGKTTGIKIDVKRENGSAYKVTNECTVDDTAIQQTETDNGIYTKNKEIFGLTTDAIIYDITGQNVTSQNGQLHTGIYIVRVNGTTQKIVVR